MKRPARLWALLFVPIGGALSCWSGCEGVEARQSPLLGPSPTMYFAMAVTFAVVAVVGAVVAWLDLPDRRSPR